jgi:hypothetical protein
MNNIERITGIPAYKNTYTDLGTEIDFNKHVEMYSNSNSNRNEKGNLNVNRFQHLDVENRVAPEALISSTGASHPGVKEDQRNTGKGYRMLSTNDLYVEIGVQINNIRLEGRYNRINVYVSVKEEMDSKYSIFLSGSATNCLTELRRGAKEDKIVLDTIETFISEHKNCLVGRLHYKAPKGVKMSNFHRKLLRHTMIAIYNNSDDEPETELYMLGDWYTIPLNLELSKKQKELFDAAGIWRREMEQFDDNEELA